MFEWDARQRVNNQLIKSPNSTLAAWLWVSMPNTILLKVASRYEYCCMYTSMKKM